jgi:predicted PurR-regulated permease PerM
MASTEVESGGILLDEPRGQAGLPTARPAAEASVPRGIAVAAAFAWRLLVIAGAAGLVLYIASKLLVLVIPFVVALLLTSLLHGPARRLQAHGVPRTLAAMLVVGLGLLVIGGLLGLIIPPFVSQATDLAGQVEDGARQLATSLGGTFGLSDREVDRAVDRAVSGLDGSSGSVAAGVLSGAMIAAEIAAAILLTIFLTFFLVRDGDTMWRWIIGLIGTDRQRPVREAGDRAWQALSAYIRGVAFVATVDAVFIGIALLAVGVPMAFQLMVLTFLAAFFPIVGAFAAGGAAVLVALVANGTTAALIILLAIIVVQQLEGNVLYPVIVGSQLKLHPVAMLLTLGAGGVLAGVAGAFLAVPVAAVVAAVLDYARTAGRRSPVALS